MTIRGYNRTAANPEFWQEQIQASLKYREKYAREKQWEKWRKYYRGEWPVQTQPTALFFKMARTIVPRIYFRNPSISVIPAKPGLENQLFAQILERVDNKLLRRMKLKQQMKRIVNQTFFLGTGIGKIGFGAQYTPTPDPGGFTVAPTTQREKFEYHSLVEENLPWFLHVPTSNFVVPVGLSYFEETPWVAERIVRPVEDVKADPRLKNTDKIKGGSELQLPDSHQHAWQGVHKPVEMVELWEVRDKKTEQVFIIAPKVTDKVLYQDDDAMQWENRLPYHILQFNEDDEVFWGVPDSQILEPIQEEMNETKTQISKHRRLSVIRWLARRGSITEEEAYKMISETVSPVVFTESSPAESIMKVDGNNIPEDLRFHMDEQMQDARETVGFGRNQFADFAQGSADRTATEAQIVAQASAIRVDERRDMAADMLVELVRDMHQVIFSQWSAEQIVEIEGPQGAPLWVSFTGQMLREGRYEVRIDPDSSVPDTKQVREAKAIKMYELLREDPYFDPVKLRRHLLHELQGVAFDDMLVDQFQRAIGGGPNNAVPVQDLMQAIQQRGEGGGAARGGDGTGAETIQAIRNQLNAGG